MGLGPRTARHGGWGRRCAARALRDLERSRFLFVGGGLWGELFASCLRAAARKGRTGLRASRGPLRREVAARRLCEPRIDREEWVFAG